MNHTGRFVTLGTLTLSLGVTAPLLHAAGQGQPPQLTPIDDVVMYGIDADTSELLRYTFDTDSYARIGEVKDENNIAVTGLEGLAFIPRGPHVGLYGIANAGTLIATLIRISPLNAEASVYPNQIGFDGAQGLVAVQDPDTLQWSLLGLTRNGGSSDLISIDPATGLGTLVVTTGREYVSLAWRDGTIYATDEVPDLWTIDPGTGTETRIGAISDADVGSVANVIGDEELRIKVPSQGDGVVPDSWTMEGILFGYSDTDDALMIIQPSKGKAVEWPCSFQTVDFKGMVFTTQLRDPYALILASAHD